jgi:hypothetical protein
VNSPRSLQDLLLEPNLPQVDLHLDSTGATEVWLNDEPQNLVLAGNGPSAVVKGLKLSDGWNHFLLKLVRTQNRWDIAAQFTASDPGFVADLDSALAPPQ